MRRVLYIAGLLSVLLYVVQGCAKVDVESVPIVNLYEPMARFRTMDSTERRSFVERDSVCVKALFQVYRINTLSDSALISWSESSAVMTFTPDVERVFTDYTSLETTLGGILKNAEMKGLEFPKRRYAAVVWGSRKSMAFMDSVLLISLNHYLGADYPGYRGWPEYQRMVKTPEKLPYDLAEALVAVSYPYVQDDETTALSRMLYEGVIVYCIMQLVPQAILADALGYDVEQMHWLEANERSVWQRLVEKELLYTSSLAAIERLINPAPTTAQIGPEVPGRAGRFIGYRIVCAYLEQHSDMSLVELLSPEFYNNPSALIESAYQGN